MKKAIIIAAGMGRRMESMTENIPKCMLPINDKPLIQIHLDLLRAEKIDDISIVVGYKKEAVIASNVTFYENTAYLENNILESLFYAEEKLGDNQDILITYSDIIYEPKVVRALKSAENDITIVVDTKWKDAYDGRENHPLNEAEKVVFNNQKHVTHIGKLLDIDLPDISGEFIGMLKLSGRGTALLKACYHDCRQKYTGRRFQNAPVFQKAYITDILQELVDRGEQISCITIQGGWREIDTIEDYKIANKLQWNLT